MIRVERRPHLQRFCPMREQDGCEWVQVISWFVGGPENTERVPDQFLRVEAEAHLMAQHFGAAPLIFT